MWKDPTNNDRALRANTAVSVYVNDNGDNGDEQDNIADLVCDLMHLCDAQGVDWSSVLSQADMNYGAETDEQPKADPSFAEGI